jgi:hypothetical protein
LTGRQQDNTKFRSMLLDAALMRKLRYEFEAQGFGGPEPDYSQALQDQLEFDTYEHSTIAIVAVDVEKLATNSDGDLMIKLATVTFSDQGHAESDDYLGSQGQEWARLPLAPRAMAFHDLSDVAAMAPGTSQTLVVARGQAEGLLVVYLPHNVRTPMASGGDNQSRILGTY